MERVCMFKMWYKYVYIFVILYSNVCRLKKRGGGVFFLSIFGNKFIIILVVYKKLD